jgi:hypothetical protein
MSRDRREYFRHPSNLPIRCSASRDDEMRPSVLKDVGLGGICFFSAQPARPGTYLELEIPVLDQLHCFVVQTLWCTRGDEGYEIGVCFLNMDDAFRGRLVEQGCHIEAYRQEVGRRQGRELSPDGAAREWIPQFAAGFPGP